MKILFEEELNEVKESNQSRDIFQSFVYLYNQNQEVDIEAIALMSSFEKEKVLKALDCFICQDPLVFDSCHDLYAGYMTNEDYLSGNLIEKFEIANQMNLKYGGYFEKNIRLLKPLIKDINYKQVCDFLPTLKNDFKDCAKELDYDLLRQLSYQGYKLLDYTDFYKAKKEDIVNCINSYVRLAQKLPTFKEKIGYTLLSLNKDVLYHVLMHKQSIVVQMDNEKRMYEMLYGAMNLIQMGLENEVTLVSCQNICRQLEEIKKRICPNLNINIQTSRADLKDTTCVFIDDTAEISSKIKHRLSKNMRIAFFLSCLDQKMFNCMFNYFMYDFENDHILDHYYINGYLKNDISLHHRSFGCSEMQNPFMTLHLLSSILCIDIYQPNVLVFQKGNMSDLFEDVKICSTYEKTNFTLKQLIKARNNIATSSKLEKVVYWMVELGKFEHKKQLIYVDDEKIIKHVYDKFLDFGVSKDDIQILKSNANINQDKSVYISRTKKVFPYQIKDLEAIHHLDIPASLSDFYHRSSDAVQYMYAFEGSVDAYLAQNLFYEQLFFDSFLTSKSNRYLFYYLFSISTPNNDIKNMIEMHKTIYEYQTTTHIENVFKNEKLDDFERGYIKLKRRKQLNRVVDELVNYTYFDHKEKYLFTVGNYRVFLPANCFQSKPYLVLKSPSNQNVIYPFKRKEKHIDQIEKLLMKRSYLYE